MANGGLEFFNTMTTSSRFVELDTDKERKVIEAGNQKLEQLKLYKQKQAERIIRDSKTLAARIGLDNESTLGSLANIGASVIAGGVGVVKNIATSVHGAHAAYLSKDISDEVRRARASQLRGDASVDEKRLLDMDVNTSWEYQQGERKGVHSNLDQIKAWEAAQDRAAVVRDMLDASSLVYQGNREDLVTQVSKDATQIKDQFVRGKEAITNGNWLDGAGDILGSVGNGVASVIAAGADNPLATAELIAENAPQLLLSRGLGGFALTNATYGMDELTKGINEYRSANQGAMPDSDKMGEMAAWAASMVAAETVGDKLMLDGGKHLGKLSDKLSKAAIQAGKGADDAAVAALKTGDAAVDGVVKEAVKATKTDKLIGMSKDLKNVLLRTTGGALDTSIARAGVAALEGGAGEYMTEAYQTFAENQIQDKETTFDGQEGLHVAGTLGALAGGTTKGAIDGATSLATTVAENAKASYANMLKAKEEDEKKAVTDALVNKAIEEKNPDLLLDPKSESFNPGKAINVLAVLNSQEDITPEDRTKYQEKTKTVISNLQQEIDALKGNTDEGRQEQVASLEAMKTKLAAMDPANTKGRSMLEGLIGAQEDALKEALPPPDQQAAIKTQLQEKQTKLAEAQNLYDSMLIENTSEKVKDIDPKVLLQEANYDVTTPVAEGDAPAFEQTKIKAQEAVKKSVLLSMVSPDSFTAEDAMQLASNTKNVLTDTERKYFTSYAEATNSENKLKNQAQVHREVLFGDPNLNQKGLLNYKERVNRYLSARDFGAADAELMGLTKFMASHQAKAEVLTNAMDTFNKNGIPLKVMKTQENTWEYSRLMPTEDPKDVRKRGGYIVAANSYKLVNQVKDEADALTKGYDALESAYSLMKGDPTGSTEVGTTATNTTVPVESVAATTGNNVATIPTEQSKIINPDPIGTTTTTEAGTSRTGVVLSGTGKYVTKDQDKADQATKFIGRGSEKSSTARYAVDFGELANSGNYTSDDVVFISAEGNRGGRVEPDFNEIDLAIEAGASFITDVEAQRNTNYNKVGEGKVAEYLINSGYTEYEPGKWKPTELNTTAAETTPNTTVTNPAQDLAVTDVPEAGNTPTELNGNTEFESSVDTSVITEAKTESTVDSLVSTGVAPVVAETIEANKILTETTPTATEEVITDGEAGDTTEVVQEEEERDVPQPTLSVLANTEGRASKFLKQVVGIVKGAVANNILVNVPNVLTTLVQSKSSAPIDHLLSQEHREQDIGILNNIRKEMVNPKKDKVHTANLPFGANLYRIISNIPAESVEGSKFDDSNPINDFLLKKPDGSYTLDQNVMVAATAAGISFLMDSMGKGLFHTPEGLSKLLNLENKDSRPNKQAWTELGEGYVRFSVAAASIGQAVTQMLGLKDTKDAPANYRKNLETAIGSYVLQAMSESQLINQKIIKDVDFQAMRGKEGTAGKPHMQHIFINLSRNGSDRKKLSDKNLAMKQKFTGSSGSLNRLFSITPAVEYPSFTPQKFNQRKVKNSTKGVPSVIAKTLNAEQQTKLRINKPVWGIFSNLPDALANRVLGVDTRPEEHIHVANRMGINAKNEGILRGDEHLRDFVMNHVYMQDDGLDTPFYAGFDMWNQQRVGQTKAINMQSNKQHRQMIVPEQWNTEVSLKNQGMVDSLKLRILESFGTKTDSMIYSDAIDKEWAKLESNEIVQKGVAAIQQMLLDPGYELTADDQEAIVQAVEASKSNLHGLSSMVGYAQYKNALKELEANPDADVKFTTQINGEIDGINNGPILFLMAMGVSNLDHFGPKGGFFTGKDGYKNANAWKANPENLDLYQSLTRRVLDSITSEKHDANRQNLYNSLYYFTGELGDATLVTKDGRNMAKGPTTQNAFGSGKEGLLDGMKSNFIDSIYGKIEKLWEIKDVEQRNVKTQELIGNLNRIITAGNTNKYTKDVSIPMGTSLEALTDTWLPNKTQKALEQTFVNEIGNRYTGAMDSMYGEAAAKRSVVTKNAQVMNNLYVATRNAVKEAYIGQKVKEGKLSADFNSKWDLSSEMEREIEEMVKYVDPTLRTAASAQEDTLEASIDNGMSIVKRKNGQSDDPRYKPTLWSKDWDGKGKGKASTRKVTGTQQTVVDPGVGVTVKNIHSLDSSISNTQDPSLGGINVHDAKITGLQNYTDVGRGLNETTYKNLRDYSFMKEFYDSRVRQLKAINKLINTAKQDSSFVLALRDALTKMYKEAQKGKSKENPFDLQELWLTVKEAEFNKQIYLSQLAYVDQYGNEGGEYEVTDADRKAALIKAEEIAGQNVHQTVHELSSAILGFIGEDYSLMTLPKPKNSVPSDTDLTTFFRLNEVTSGKDAVAYIKSMMRRRPNRNKFYEYLLDKIEPALTDNITIQLVRDPKTLPPEKYAPNSRGWSDADGTIYLLDPRLENSGLTTELVIHELTHAVLRNIIAKPVNAVQRKAVHRLTKLMQSVAKKANTKDMYVDPNALTSVDEFVSWGISNPTFQKEVLGKLTFGGRIANAINQFINNIGQLLFGTESMAANSALAKVLFYSDQLFDEAAKNVPSYRAVNGELFSMMAPERTFSTKDVFDGLDAGTVSSKFNESMNRVMESVVSSLHGMAGSIKAEIEADTPTALDAWVAAELKGERMFAGKVKAANVPFSDRELFVAEQVEAVMGDILKEAAPSNNNAYAELSKLYLQAREQLKGQISPELYKFVFMPQRGMGNTSDYMSRFVALGLGNETFNKALGFTTEKVNLDYKGKPFVERLELTWRALLDWFGAHTTNTRMGQAGNDKLAALATKLVQIELNNRSKVKGNRLTDMLEPGHEFLSRTLEGARDKVMELASSQAVRESGVAAVRATGAVVRAVGGDKVGKMIDGLNEIINSTSKGLPGTVRETINYTKGLGKWINEVVQVAKVAEKQRMETIADTAKGVMDSFKDAGKHITPETEVSISKVLLRTGAFTLLDDYGIAGIKDMIEDTAQLNKAIESEFAKLSGFKEQHYYHTQAKALANLRTSGWASVDNLNTNAYGISRLYGTGKVPPAYATEAKPVIERLVSLYGLKYSEKSDALMEVLRTEANREDGGNGIEQTLRMHRKIYEDSKKDLFDGNESLMFHGYLAEVHNPKTDFVVVRDADDGAKYEEQGYVLSHQIPLDKHDTDQRPALLYVLRGGGLLRRQTGGISLTGMNAKGKTKHGNYYDPTNAKGYSNMQSMSSIYQAKQAEMHKQFMPVAGFDPRKVTENKMVPLFNEDGKIVDYRYMMKEDMRDSLLDRDNRFAHLLGVSKASVADKVNTRKNNRKVIEELKRIYRKDYARNPQNFVRIHHGVPDEELREIWDLLPNGTIQDIHKIWGVGGIYVPKTMVRPLFGQRRASMSYVVNKEKLNVPEQIYLGLARGILRQYGSMKLKLRGDDLDKYANRVGVGIRRFEDVWQEIVAEMKDTIVVKTLTVFAENVVSNTSILKMYGMSNVDIVKYQVDAFKAVMDYERDRSALAQLKIKMDTGYTQGDEEEIEAEIVRLESELQKNPVKELIDAGLKPTLVEDVNMEDNEYSYKSQLTEWINEKTDGWNKQMLDAGKVLYMTHDSTLYKLLSKSTQYSDFVARYALFKHQTTRKKNPLSKADALYEVSEAFVNYDINLPKWLDFGDRMGILPFIKYFLSIQRVIYKLIKDHPVDVLSTVLLFKFLDGLTTVMDSSALLRIGNNPLDIGALGYPGSLGELATLQPALSLID